MYAEPEHAAARELLARSFEQLGYLAEASTWRNAYLSGAFELRNGGPAQGISRRFLIDVLRHTDPERFLDAMAASLNGPAASALDLRINLVFSDLGRSYRLHIENGVLHHQAAPPDPAASATLTLSWEFFLQIVTGAAGGSDLLLSDQTDIEGSRIDLARFFRLLDQAPGTFAIVTREP